MEYNRHNFYRQTFCLFTEVFDWPESAPHHISNSGSHYYFTIEGVVRISNHWGRAARCKWRLIGLPHSNRRRRAGFARWSDFKTDTPQDFIYWIGFDPETKTYHYYHKDGDTYAGQPLADEAGTMKALRKLRAAARKSR